MTALEAYLAGVRRHDLLSPEQEHALATRAVRGDDAAACALVVSNLRLVVKIAFELARSRKSVLDVIQQGNLGLLHAVRKFDPERGVKLSTYAAWWIRAYVFRWQIENARLVRLGTTQAQRKIYFTLSREKAKLAALGLDTSAEALGRRLAVDPETVAEMESRLSAPETSLDSPDPASGRRSVREDPVADARPADEAIAVERRARELSKHLSRFAQTLGNRDRLLFRERLLSDEPRTLESLGEILRVSRERVRQIERRILEALREYIAREMPQELEDVLAEMRKAPERRRRESQARPGLQCAPIARRARRRSSVAVCGSALVASRLLPSSPARRTAAGIDNGHEATESHPWAVANAR